MDIALPIIGLALLALFVWAIIEHEESGLGGRK
jgi:hypothetical protein